MTATITVQGGLTAQPELRVLNGGQTVINFTVASTERYKDKTGEWKDGKTLYLRCEAWRDTAAGIEASLGALDKGTQVTVTGKLYTKRWEGQDGTKRSETQLEVTDLAVSVKRATVTATRHDPQARQQAPTQAFAPAPAWNTAQPATGGQGDVWGAPGTTYNDESPF